MTFGIKIVTLWKSNGLGRKGNTFEEKGRPPKDISLTTSPSDSIILTNLHSQGSSERIKAGIRF